MYKILTTVVLSGLLLAGCGGKTEEQSAVEEEVEEVEVTESSIFVDDIQTTFTVELTETPTITEEETEIAYELIEHVNQSEEVLTDRDHIKNASANYPNHTYEELYDIYNRYFWNSHYRGSGEYHVTPSAMFDVYDEVIERNIVDGVANGSAGHLEHREIGNELKITGVYGIGGQPAKIIMRLEIDDETSEATLVHLAVDSEVAVIK